MGFEKVWRAVGGRKFIGFVIASVFMWRGLISEYVWLSAFAVYTGANVAQKVLTGGREDDADGLASIIRRYWQQILLLIAVLIAGMVWGWKLAAVLGGVLAGGNKALEDGRKRREEEARRLEEEQKNLEDRIRETDRVMDDYYRRRRFKH